MRVGLISDTHGKLRNDVFSHFEGVDHILHAGDIEDLAILAALRAIAPVDAVYGNTDGFDVRRQVPERVERMLAGRSIVVIHGHQFGSPEPRALGEAFPHVDVLVFGHTHRPLIHRAGPTLFVNPGAAGPPRFGLKPSVAVLEISEETEDVRLIDLAE